jgi:acetolactate synthase-1/3 small subunit
MKQRILSLLVDNTSGVLSRIAGLFSRRGYNIDSITAGVTMDPRFTRITIVTSGDDQILEQITKQVEKQEDVRHVKILNYDDSVIREMILIKVKCAESERQDIIALANVFRASIVDVGKDSLTIEVTGSKNKTDALIKLLSGHEILEIARTGAAGLRRGSDDVIWLD